MQPHTPELAQARRVYERALIERSVEDAERAITSALTEGAHPLEIYDKIIVPTQIAIGDRWHSGEMSVSEEHLATQISIDQLNRLRALIKPKPPLHKRVIVGAVSGDSHWLGARIVADHFFHDGWNVDFLGTSPPIADLVDYVSKVKPDLIVLSVTVPAELDAVGRLTQRLSRMKNPPKLVIGGRVFEKTKPNPALKDIPVTNDPREALRIGRELCGVSRSEAELEQLLAAVGQKLQARRKELRLSQKEVADRAELDRAYISSIEGGKQNVTLGVLLKLASVLELTVSELLQMNQP